MKCIVCGRELDSYAEKNYKKFCSMLCQIRTAYEKFEEKELKKNE